MGESNKGQRVVLGVDPIFYNSVPGGTTIRPVLVQPGTIGEIVEEDGVDALVAFESPQGLSCWVDKRQLHLA